MVNLRDDSFIKITRRVQVHFGISNMLSRECTIYDKASNKTVETANGKCWEFQIAFILS